MAASFLSHDKNWGPKGDSIHSESHSEYQIEFAEDNLHHLTRKEMMKFFRIFITDATHLQNQKLAVLWLWGVYPEGRSELVEHQFDYRAEEFHSPNLLCNQIPARSMYQFVCCDKGLAKAVNHIGTYLASIGYVHTKLVSGR